MEAPPMLLPTAHVARSAPRAPFIRRFYIFLKAHYLLFFASFGMLYPIINITLRSRGLSNSELSYINIIIPFLIFFTNPLLGFIADQSRRYLLTFNFVLILTTVIYTILFILPTVKSRDIQAKMNYDYQQGYVLNFCASQEIATKCASRSECGCSYQAYCTFIESSRYRGFNQSKTFFFNFSMASTEFYKEVHELFTEPALCGIEYEVTINQAVEKYTQSRLIIRPKAIIAPSPVASCKITCSTAHLCHGPRHANQTLFVLLYSLLFILGTNFLSNAIALGASIGFATLTNPDKFGQQRLFGTFGFGLGAFVASRIYGLFHSEYVYIIMFAATTLLCIVTTSFIHIHPRKRIQSLTDDENTHEIEMEDFSQDRKSKPKKNKVRSRINELFCLLKKVDVIVFLSHTLICGMSYGVLDPYLYLYIDEIAACESNSIIGWMSLVASTAEIFAFFVAGYVLKFLGSNLTSVVVLLAFVVRFGGYYFIQQPYLLIVMESMHFFNFGILYVLIVQKADSIAPHGLSGTLQGVSLGLLFGLGKGVGLLVASLIYKLPQRRILFLAFAIFNLSAAIIYSIYFLGKRLCSKPPNETNNDETKTTAKQLSEDPLLERSTIKEPDRPTDD